MTDTMQVETTATEVVLTRMINAPRSLVYRAWTDPNHVRQWWGPHNFTIPVCDMDVRPGGTYRVVMRSTDGIDYPIKGGYREIVEPERIVMTMDCSEHPDEWHDFVKPNRSPDESNPAGEMLSTVTFDEQGAKTKVTIRMRFESAAIRDAMMTMGMVEGWTQSLDRLEKSLTTP